MKRQIIELLRFLLELLQEKSGQSVSDFSNKKSSKPEKLPMENEMPAQLMEDRTPKTFKAEPLPIYYSDPISRASIIGASIRGEDHKLNGLLCQDAYRVSAGSVAGETWVAIAVADGHGSKAHDLSHIGSAKACWSACQILEEAIFENFSETDGLQNFLNKKFPQNLMSFWWKSCQFDNWLNNQVNSEEKASFNVERYGTTLLTTLLFKNTLFCCRIGDGDITVRFNDGTLTQVFKDDEDLLGSQTYSLASTNVFDHVDIHIFPRNKIQAIFLSTDGLCDAHDLPVFQNFLSAVYDQIQEYGPGPVSKLLPKSLEKVSEKFGDDITFFAMTLEKNGDNLEEESKKPEVEPVQDNKDSISASET